MSENTRYFEIEELNVAIPDGEAEIHILINMKKISHPFVMRFKTKQLLNEFIQSLIRHGERVWPK